MSEAALSKKITAWLKENEIYYFKPRGGAYGKRGMPDYIICVGGRFAGLEIKSSGGAISLMQKKEQEQIRRSGGFVCTVWPATWPFIKSALDAMRIAC